MIHPHFYSGGRYPVLRALGILYLVLAAVGVLAGLVAAGWALTSAPWDVGNRVVLALLTLAGTFFVVVSMLAIAEIIKLAIDIEHNTRLSAINAMGSMRPAVPGAEAATSEHRTAGGRMGDLDEETAESALIRGH